MKKPIKTFSALLALSALCAASLALSPGTQAPDFTALNQDGKEIRLSDLKGKYVLLYFYPKDDTPGCTKEACAFRDGFSLIQRHNTAVFGVSKQGQSSHQDFRAKYKLPFDLIADVDGKLAKLYGIDSMPLVGYFKRQSVLISPTGRILKTYVGVDPETHARQVLHDIEGAQGGLQ